MGFPAGKEKVSENIPSADTVRGLPGPATGADKRASGCAEHRVGRQGSTCLLRRGPAAPRPSRRSGLPVVFPSSSKWTCFF